VNETLLRLKGIIGELRPLALLIMIVAVLLLGLAISNFVTALGNPAQPQPVTIGQLVDGTVGRDQYVSASGYAYYDWGYTETENGRTVAAYYYLVNESTGHAVVVKADTPKLDGRTSKNVTLTGMTKTPSSDLYVAIDDEVAALREQGLETTPSVYVAENARPPDMLGALALLFLSGIVISMCLAVYLFPASVFASQPVQIIPGPVQGNEGVKASGKFLKLKQVRPSIEIGRGSRRFSKAVANIVTLGGNRLMIYIHHVVRTRVYGIPVGTSRSDWGVFLDHDNVSRVEPGILYGWKKRWAVRIEYVQKNKPQTLIVSFDQPWGQNLFVKRLRLLGFSVAQADAQAAAAEMGQGEA
jgi:hypothetical protein